MFFWHKVGDEFRKALEMETKDNLPGVGCSGTQSARARRKAIVQVLLDEGHLEFRRRRINQPIHSLFRKRRA
jgi:hypothetical protein